MILREERVPRTEREMPQEMRVVMIRAQKEMPQEVRAMPLAVGAMSQKAMVWALRSAGAW